MIEQTTPRRTRAKVFSALATQGRTASRKEEEKSGVSTGKQRRWLHFRIGVLTLGIIMLFGAVLNRMFDLQVEETDLDEMAQRQVEGSVTLGAGGENHLDGHRGFIFDRQGYELAISVEVPSVYAHPKQIEDKHEAARQLAAVLGGSPDTIYAKLEKERSFVWLDRKITPSQGDAIRELKLRGIGLKRASKRYYPAQDIAGQIIGFAGTDNVGLAGVEAAFDEELRGGVIELKGLRDARGKLLLTLESPRLNDLEGGSVVLSIDQRIQRITEAALERTATEFKAKNAIGIVMDPKTGEILSMATWPRFNPNRFNDFETTDWRNRAVLDVYEPGSVFKLLLYAAALDAGVVKPHEPIDQEHGKMRFSSEVTLSDTHVIKSLDAEGVVVQSSNIGAYKIAKRLGREAFYQKILDFGFNAKTDIGVPGESVGIVWPPKRWAEITFANIAFGQGISVSPIQLAMAVSVIANDGELMKPLLFKEVRDREGNVIKTWEPEVKRRVVSPEAARLTRIAMEKVVTEGTGMRAWVDGYRVGGKTGTPQKVDPRTKKYGNKWMANFVGFAPVDNPDIVVVILIDEPKVSHLGGMVAAPAFAEIVSQVLPYRGIQPEAVYAGNNITFPTRVEPADPLTDAEWELASEPPPGMLRVPDFMGLSLADTLTAARDAGLTIEPESTGFVVDQWPAKGAEVAVGTPVQVTLARQYRQSHLGYAQQ